MKPLCALKLELIQLCLQVKNTGNSPGTSGNLSFRHPNGSSFFITPSGTSYETLTPEQLVELDCADGRVLGGTLKPSSEWYLHLALYQKNPLTHCIIHAHSEQSTAFSCLGIDLPPIHYHVAWCGDKVPLAKYALYGSQEIAQNILSVMQDYNACLMANHGVITIGQSMQQAFTVFEAVETVCRYYLLAKPSGQLNILSQTQIEAVVKKFRNGGY